MFWRVALVCALLTVIYLSLRPMSGAELFVGVDKVFHGLTYATLYVMAWLAFPGPVLRWRIHLGLLAFGGLLEVLQGLSGHRSMDGADILANVTGTGLGSLFLSLGNEHLPAWVKPVRDATGRPLP